MRLTGDGTLPYADDLERRAAELLGADVAGFIGGGAGEGRTVAGNRTAFDGYRLRPRVLVGVENVDLSTQLLGVPMAAPLLIAPMGTHALVHPDGELASTAVARELGIGVIASSAASRTLEETAELGARPRWFQLYMFRDRGVVADLLDRVRAAGYDAVCLTVDTPVLGDRRTDRRTRFVPDANIRWSNLDRYARGALPKADDGTTVARYIAEQMDPSLTWNDVSWLRDQTDLPIVLKGVLDPVDARTAIDGGVQGLVVSNHGGRQLDRAIASLDALPEVVDAVAGRIPVVFDGGIREAADVLIALALGASAVTVGRPVMWALAAGGSDMVHRYLAELVEDLQRSLQVLGRRSIGELDRTAVVRTS